MSEAIENCLARHFIIMLAPESQLAPPEKGKWQRTVDLLCIHNKPYVEPRPPKSQSFNHPYLNNLRRFWNEQVVCSILPGKLCAQQIS